METKTTVSGLGTLEVLCIVFAILVNVIPTTFETWPQWLVGMATGPFKGILFAIFAPIVIGLIIALAIVLIVMIIGVVVGLFKKFQ